MNDAVPRRRFGLITRSEANAAGITDAMLGGRAYRRVGHRVYADSSYPVTEALRLDAALLVAPPETVVARQSAARLWRGIVPDSPMVTLNLPGHRRLRLDGVEVRSVSSDQVVLLDGRRITSPAQTFCELATVLDLVDLVVLGDSLVRAAKCRPEDLVQRAAQWRGARCRLARRAAALVRRGVRSPRETRLRMLIVLAGLPEPLISVEFRDADGRTRYELDLAYRAKIGVEYDGEDYHSTPQARERDAKRRRWFTDQGWTVLTYTKSDLWEEPRALLEQLVSIQRRHGMAVRIRSDEWIRYFPGRRAAG
ncbi:endonuclease domain-containing protein [Branchiibius cervicis]|uniref:Endonuclease domain-containing protein n=1 Tax=Branchiibius cervicis TaxID=908252 RepID=A0ABW2AUU1_9MICO